MIGKENYLLYMIVTNIASAKKWNENIPEVSWGPKFCQLALITNGS